MAHVGLCFSRKMVRRTPLTPFHDHNGLTIQEEGKEEEKGTLLTSPVCEGKEPRENARKCLMQAA